MLTTYQSLPREIDWFSSSSFSILQKMELRYNSNGRSPLLLLYFLSITGLKSCLKRSIAISGFVVRTLVLEKLRTLVLTTNRISNNLNYWQQPPDRLLFYKLNKPSLDRRSEFHKVWSNPRWFSPKPDRIAECKRHFLLARLTLPYLDLAC